MKGWYLHDYFKMIDRSIRPILEPGDNPLILAAVTREIATYRSVNTYRRLLAPAIEGSPDVLSRVHLFAKARQILASNYFYSTETLHRDMEEAGGRGRVLQDVEAIHRAAQIGTNEDWINSAALAVIRHSGTIHCVKPGELAKGLAAILGYQTSEAEPSSLGAPAIQAYPQSESALEGLTTPTYDRGKP